MCVHCLTSPFFHFIRERVFSIFPPLDLCLLFSFASKQCLSWIKAFRWVRLFFICGAANRSGRGKCYSSCCCWGIWGGLFSNLPCTLKMDASRENHSSKRIPFLFLSGFDNQFSSTEPQIIYRAERGRRRAFEEGKKSFLKRTISVVCRRRRRVVGRGPVGSWSSFCSSSFMMAWDLSASRKEE